MLEDPKFWEGIWQNEHGYVQAAIRRAWWLGFAVNVGLLVAAVLAARYRK
jgi:hypothetical protein